MSRRTPRCSNNCGRRVWHYDTRLCGACDPRSQKGRRQAVRYLRERWEGAA